MSNKIYKYRSTMRCVIECVTPLAISEGEKDILTDSKIARDVNGLPFIPGTSLTGILRHALSGSIAEDIFGFQGKNDEGEGSKLIFSDGCLLSDRGEVVEGLISSKELDTDFFQHYQVLPIRQHCRIDDTGSTVAGGKFDGQIVFKGSRFCFEMELISDKQEDLSVFDKIISELQSKLIRLGGGTRSGFGAIQLVEAKKIDFDLENKEQLRQYIDKTSSLNDAIWNTIDSKISIEESKSLHKVYDLVLKADDFFLFGAGFGDDEVDMAAVQESIVKWDKDKAYFVDGEKTILIPASSLKGALAHRTAFHYNAIRGWFADSKEKEGKTSLKNPAVLALFGSEGKETENKLRGNMIFSDIIEQVDKEEKILNHVAIDRFTGGGIDGALFSEKVNYTPSNEYATKIVLDIVGLKKAIEFFPELIEEDAINAFEKALKDLCEGLLPLGGGVMRGNGCFKGTYNVNN